MFTLENRAPPVEDTDVGSTEVVAGLASAIRELTGASNHVARSSQEISNHATEQSENVSQAATGADEEQTAKSNEIQTLLADRGLSVIR